MDSISQNQDPDESNLNEVFNNSLQNSEENSEILVENNESSQRSTFKNTLQAKKRLQAFCAQKQGLNSPSSEKNKIKTILVNETTNNDKEELQDNISLKKPLKKCKNPLDKAKAVIEEIELLKKFELLQSTPSTIEQKLFSISGIRRSRSKSSERDFVFRKRERKVRNYRKNDTSRRSPSPVITKTKKDKPSEKTNNYKYPRNWEEFNRDKWTFGKLLSKVSHFSGRTNTLPNDISRHLLFETPPESIKSIYYKDEKGVEILVPYKFLRYTTAKPRISFNVNFNNMKENFLNREQILSKTNNNYKVILERFLGKNTRTKFRAAEPIGQRNWYQRNWKDNESRVLETSIGLSFLQNYSDDDDDEEEDELIFEPPATEKVQEAALEKEQLIMETKLQNIYLEEHHKSEDVSEIDESSSEIRIAESKCYEHKENESVKSQKNDKKSTESTPSSFKEDELSRNRTELESFQVKTVEKTDASWTPERINQISETMWDETPKKKKDKLIYEERKRKRIEDTNSENIEEKQRAREIHSEDEWDETPKRRKEKSTSEETDVKKPKKKKNTKISDTDSSSEEKKKSKRKKRKLDRKRKQKEKVKKARKKKEKLKAEKLKLKKEKKRRQKEREKEVAEKEILKKLKKEIEHNLEEVEREERENNKNEGKIEMLVKVKVEKVDDHEKGVRSAEDLRNYLDKKTGKVKDLREKVEKKRQKEKDKESSKKIKITKKESFSRKLMEIKGPINNEIKNERLFKEDKHKEKIECDLIDREEFVGEEDAEEVFPLEKEIGNSSLLDVPDNIEHNIVETEQNLQEISKGVENQMAETEMAKSEIISKEELACETTPDTDEYHSNWESDEGISSIVKITSKKADRSWESDEETFGRSYLKENEPQTGPLIESSVLEMPLHLKKFPRRRRQLKVRPRPRSPEYLDVDSEIKLLEAERINLSKERMQLEIEKIRIHELEREKSMEEVEYMGEAALAPSWQPENFRKKQERRQSRWDLREDHVDSSTSLGGKEKVETQRSRSSDKGVDSMHNSEGVKPSEVPNNASLGSNSVLSVSSSPEITSTESPKPTVLESAYQEFIRAVSTGDDSKDFLVISSAESDRPCAAGNGSASQKKTRLTRSERDRNRERCIKKVETSGEQKIRGITDPKLLRDILLPGEVPVEEIPMPVPSPKVQALQNLPSTVVLNVMPVPELTADVHTSQDSQESSGKNSDQSPSKKPFSFSTLVLPSKKPVLLEKSNWKLDEDSDEDLPPKKKKLEEIKTEHENLTEALKEKEEEKPKSTGDTIRQVEEVSMKIEATLLDKKEETTAKKVEKTKDVKEKDKRKDVEEKRKDVEDKRKDVEDKRKDDRSSKRRHSRSKSPVNAPKDKRRRDEDARRREEDQRRRDEDTRRRDEDARRKEEDTRRRDSDSKRKDEENKKRETESRRKEEDVRKKEDESKRRDRGKRPLTPQRHRESSPRRRRLSSPAHRRSSPRHRSSPRRQEPLRRSERNDRRSPPPRSSPARRKRSHSPSRRGPTIRRRSSGSREKSPRHHQHGRRSKSPGHSPMDGLKRSLADSTISDDLLPQPYVGEASNSPLSSSTPVFAGKKSKLSNSPKRLSLDERINQVLGVEAQPAMCWKPEEHQLYTQTQANIYPGYHQQETLLAMGPSTSSITSITSKVVQVGNILQVVPTEEITLPPTPQFQSVQKIVQVGNMLQIVPTEMDVILPPLPPPPPPRENPVLAAPPPEKQSAEAILAAKNAERLAERAKKRHEKEERKKEKEKKRKEREKKRKMQLKISTEEVIKRALEMDGLIIDENEDLNALVPEIISDTPGLDPSKSILLNSTSRYLDQVIKSERGKSVQFADGVRPGEGTSPSGGEELSSPPPQTEDLPRAKKFRKLEAAKKKKKRKIKVKVVKKRHSTPDSDLEYENLPPPSPPPGSPPPHVFPLRVKVHTINNIPQHYLPSFGIATAPQQPPMIGQQPPVINLGYQAATTAVYRPSPPSHINVIGQHYARTGHGQPMGGHMHATPQLAHSHVTTSITHREHQPYGSF